MSEYQYYEFLAMDRLLTQREMGELRSISSRAEITPSNFSNEYNWGDLKADPGELLERYFDLHLYLANWGTRRLAMKLPLEAFPLEEVKPYLVSDCASVRPRLGMGVSSSSADLVDDGAVVRGLQPAGEFQAMAEFLRIDEDLIYGSLLGEQRAHEPEPLGLAQWIGRLPVEEKDALLLRVARGEHAAVEAVLSRRFKNEARAERTIDRGGRRTVVELLNRADEIQEARESERARKAEEARRQREATVVAARKEHLDALASRKARVWEEIEKLVSATKPKCYDLAVKRLVDLRELAQRDNHEKEFGRRLIELRGRHLRKPSFNARLDKAGLSPARA